ncbi:MAG: peptide/nickel transport system ATP-binding protein [Halobacteriales archaeon]|jgi:peptide/nickel transport system ATP-binding protein
MSQASSMYQEQEESETQIGDTLVEVNDLKTYYGGQGMFADPPVRAVDGVTFDIKKGETLGVVGESGCGKTTLGRTLIQLENAREGSIEYEGTDITALSGKELKQWRKNVQMVFQDPESSLNERMTVGEIVKEPLDVHEWKEPADRRARVREILDIVGLHPEHYYRYPHQFSGGQKQRVGIARALALEPEFVILDEPVSALDASVQAKILNLLDDLQDRFGLTYLLIAHDLSVVEQITDRVAVMYLGHVLELGNTDELFDDPANPYTLSLLSAIPEPDPTTEKRRITLRGTPPNPRDPPEGCPFTTRCPMKIRPEKYRDIDDELWEAIEIFREIARERTRIERSWTSRVKTALGGTDPYQDVDEIVEDTFGHLDVPSEVRSNIAEAADRIKDGNEEAAVEYLKDEFGSVCDADEPDSYTVGDTGRYSKCHRHAAEFEEPRKSVEIYETT